jgi:hypothetical protein
MVISMVFKSHLTTLVLAFMSFIASAASLDVLIAGPPPLIVPTPKPSENLIVSTTSIQCDNGQKYNSLSCGECLILPPNPLSAKATDANCSFWNGFTCGNSGTQAAQRIVDSGTCGELGLGTNVSAECC